MTASPASGTSGRVVLARISETDLSVDECLAAVAHPEAGGTGLFVGTVRRMDEGRSVTSLRYEAHPSAGELLAEVCGRIAARGVIAVAAEHRVGELVVGDVAVVVTVSAEHRAEALDATRELIDTIKSEVPIWKHQHFTDGTDEWVGCA